MGKVMRHTLGASLNIRHNLSSSKWPKPLQLKLLTTYIPKTSAFTLAFSTSQRLRTTMASARTFFIFRHYITPSSRNFFFFNASATTETYTLSLHDALPIFHERKFENGRARSAAGVEAIARGRSPL